MSPSEAPESVEPYWATASFSSAISSALIETLHLARLLVEDDDAGVDLLADGEALGALLVAVARQIGALDEGRRCRCSTSLTSMPPSLTPMTSQVTTAPFLHVRRQRLLGERIPAELLDAERDALLLDVDVEHLAP